MSAPGLRGSGHGPCRWGTVRAALGSWAKTLQLCLIVLATSIPPSLIVFLIRR
jgi:hypothetical protein